MPKVIGEKGKKVNNTNLLKMGNYILGKMANYIKLSKK